MPDLNGGIISVDYEALQSMANGFQNSSDVMTGVAQALEVAIRVLEASALLGNVGAAAMARYLDGIKPNLERLAATCTEMSGDLEATVAAFQEGDYSGSTKFNR